MSSSVIDLLATEARFGAQNYQPIGVVLTRGEGVWVWDTEGNRYLDCLSAYSAPPIKLTGRWRQLKPC